MDKVKKQLLLDWLVGEVESKVNVVLPLSKKAKTKEQRLLAETALCIDRYCAIEMADAKKESGYYGKVTRIKAYKLITGYDLTKCKKIVEDVFFEDGYGAAKWIK